VLDLDVELVAAGALVGGSADLRRDLRRDLGDAATGVRGENIRPIGRVDNPKPLTEYDPDHPYIMAMYDKHHRG